MKYCASFETRLLAGLPHPLRYSIENTMRAFTSSHAVLRLCSTAVGAAVQANGNVDPIIFAIGSFGRLDGQTHISDVDAIYLYGGRSNQAQRKALQEMVCHLVTCNKCLRFDRREELEAGTFDFSKSPAYPVLGVSELNGVASRTRVVQILTEGRAIRNEDRAQTIQERLLVNLGYASDTPHLDFGPFRAALASFRDAYCSGTIGKGRAKKWPLSNRKIVKLFALREFSYLANLFSLAEIAMRVSPKQLITGDAIPLISSPSILKIASFASPLGVFGMFAQALGQGPIEQMEKLLAEDYKDLPEGDRGFIDPILASNREGNLITYLRAFILPVLSKFDSLLQSLHDEDSLAAFDEWASDTATWSAIPLFKRILDRRNAMVEGLRTFAGELRKLLAIIEQHGYVTHDADESLKQVTDYKLQLSSTY